MADARPVVRLGLRAMLQDADDFEVLDACAVEDLVARVEEHDPDVVVVAIRENDPDPFRTIATVTALDEDVRVVVVADSATVIDLREAVVAGASSFLLSTTSLDEIRDAVTATAQGERVVSPEVAMQLAGTWRGESDQPVSGLTPRELEVLQLLAEGLTNKQVGERINLSARTVKTHVQNLLSKLDVPDRTGAVARGFRLGLIR